MIGLRRATVVRGGAAGGAGAQAFTARGPAGARPGLLLTIEDDAGQRGQGEASPLPGWSRETVDGCAAALEGLPWGRVELDEGRLLEDVGARVDQLGAALPAARFALETALLDLAGRILGAPLPNLLPARGTVVGRATCSSLLTADDEAGLLAQAAAAIARGFGAVKWKIGRPGAFERELAALRALRRAVGPDMAIRLDANGAFGEDEVLARLEALAEIAPELVEEPTAGRLDRLPARPPVPLAVDERLLRPGGFAEAEQAIGAGAISAVVLKPTLLGGSLACLRIAARARALGAAAIVTHAFEGPVGLTAVAALALALPSPRRAAGIDRHLALSSWPEVALPLRGGAVEPWTAPGLGLAPLSLEPA